MRTIVSSRIMTEGLTMEYTRKLEMILEKLPVRTFEKLDKVAFTGFTTYDRLSLDEAYSKVTAPMPAGMNWGRKFEYGWFFADYVIPQSAKGQRVVFQAQLGECLVFVNGKVAGALDKEHMEITLTRDAVPGEKYRIAIEVYAGHGEVYQNLLVIPEDMSCLDTADKDQKTVKEGSVSIFREEVFQLWLDLNTLYTLRKQLPENSWRIANVDKALKNACDALDIEAPVPEFFEFVKSARAAVAPALACKNGTSIPTMYGISNSHLDLEWMWTKEETRRKAARTISNQLRLIEEYDDYIYYQTQPWLLESIKNDYPDLYEEVKYWVKQGRFVIDGGMWVQADVNIPSGESLIRQFMQGKKFICEEFGTESKVFWLPDSFGAPGSLPQILAGCDVSYFVSAKIPWLYNGGDQFPYSNFNWKGIDGTTVSGYIINGYNTFPDPKGVDLKTVFYKDKEDIPDSMMLLGHGDGGGGATRLHVEYVHREKDLEGIAKVKFSTPMEYFDHIAANYETKNTFLGELYFAAHRGTYTTRGRTKLLNRRTEFALRDAEMWSALCGYDAKKQTDAMWKKVLFNQFHDIVPGSCMDKVYEVSEGIYEDVMEQCGDIVQKACCGSTDTNKIALFNSLSWDRTALVTLPEGVSGISGAQTQVVDGKVIALLGVPACGSTVYSACTVAAVNSCALAAPVLENDLVRAEFNENGELISLTDKSTGMEFLSSASNRLRMYKDTTGLFDAWDIDSTYERAEISLDHETKVSDIFTGPLVSGLTITKKLNNSKLVQKVRLYKDSRVLHFETEVDWKERHKLLKVDFNTNILSEDMISEIQYGFTKRPTHKNRLYDADRFEVLQHRWSALAENNRGVALLNDCKYGISADGSRISLTLLKSAMAPMPDVDKGVHNFTYCIMPFTENLYASGVVQEAMELNCPVCVVCGGKQTASAIRVSNKNVIVDAVKLADDGSGDLIVRLYESMNGFTHCKLTFGFDVKQVFITNMLEDNREEAQISDNSIELNIKAFQVVTLRVRR